MGDATGFSQKNAARKRRLKNTSQHDSKTWFAHKDRLTFIL
jgi:hypothetical protein